MPKFFIDKELIKKEIIIIEGDEANHINVLRHKEKDIIELCDGVNKNYICELKSINKKQVVCKVLDVNEVKNESKVKVTLYQGIPKKDKMELIIQKWVELGGYEIVPIITQNTLIKEKEKINRKIERWQKISKSAAEQSGRGFIPKIKEAITFQDAINNISSKDVSLIAYEKETKGKIENKLINSGFKNINIFIGAEGGFTEGEIDLCRKNEINSITLGKRILRTETAGFTLLTLILFLKGEFYYE